MSALAPTVGVWRHDLLDWDDPKSDPPRAQWWEDRAAEGWQFETQRPACATALGQAVTSAMVHPAADQPMRLDP
jgi:hypothetical protein